MNQYRKGRPGSGRLGFSLDSPSVRLDTNFLALASAESFILGPFRHVLFCGISNSANILTAQLRSRLHMLRVFLNYRREDSESIAGRIFDRLHERFGPENVFRDLDTITPGAEFARMIGE